MAEIKLPVTIQAGKPLSVPVALTVDQPSLWSDESPVLYRVNLCLEIKGQPARTLSYRTGFRRLELSPKGARLNGSFIKFRGVNHLTYHPDHGMYTPADWLRRRPDIRAAERLPGAYLLSDHLNLDEDEMALVGELPRYSVGPRSLHADHTITVLLNELDRREP